MSKLSKDKSCQTIRKKAPVENQKHGEHLLESLNALSLSGLASAWVVVAVEAQVADHDI